MKFHRSLVLMVCLLSLAAAASADRPECPRVNGGACFMELSDMGLFGFLTDPNNGTTVIVGPFDEDNDFARVGPNGRIRLHQIDRDIDIIVCVGDPGCSDDPTHFGTGHVSANASFTPSFDLSCPTSIQVHGDVTDVPGDEFELRAALILTPNKRAGCKLVLGSVSVTPK